MPPPANGRSVHLNPPAGRGTSGLGSQAWDAQRSRVLVVDDEPLLRRSLRRVLEKRGFDVQCAENGKQADELFAESDFDVVLSDIAMPDWDGIRLLQRLHELDPDIPVILITGKPAVSTAVQALEFGAFHYLTKPVKETRLEEVVERAAYLRRMALMKRRAIDLVRADEDQLSLEQLRIHFDQALATLWMAYQPIVRASNGSIFGFEALLRSSEPALPHPGAVLDAAARLERQDELGRRIRRRSAGPMATAPTETTLFVNLHTTDLLDSDLLDREAELSRIAGRVVLEVTERSSLESVTDVRRRIAALREMGFRIAVDDLGAGYAGLTSFALLEPEIVKLDMSLIRGVHQSHTRQKLIRSMTSLCKDMGMLVVAEGVETEDEWGALVDLGCDLLQGFLLAKPGPPFPLVERRGRIPSAFA